MPTKTDLILQWAHFHLRQFPWRYPQNLTPYRMLLAELLLKRTTAVAVAKVYESFLTEYPSLEVLSSAPQRELEMKFRPVGLYVQRAGAIVRLTEYLATTHRGMVPGNLEDLRKVPGLGGIRCPGDTLLRVWEALCSCGQQRPTDLV